MQELEISKLDRALLYADQVMVYIQEPGRSIKRRIVVFKVSLDDFIIDTALYEKREPEPHTYRGTREERDKKLTDLGCPPDNSEWTREVLEPRKGVW